MAGSGSWVFVEYLVGRFIGCSLGCRGPSEAVVWGVLGCAVVMTSWEIDDFICILLVVGVSSWLAGCGRIFIVLRVAEAWYGLAVSGGSRIRF